MKNTWSRSIWGPDSLGLKWQNAGVAELWGHAAAQTARGDRLSGIIPASRVNISDLVPNLFEDLLRPLSPNVPGLAERLAELFFPPNLQGFSETEWAQLIGMVTDDGIGLMWAPGKRHLRALLDTSDREGRYAYLHAQRADLFDEVDTGLDEVQHEDLADLRELGTRAVATARAGLWEAALALATNVVYTAMETQALDWYREEFKHARDDQGELLRPSGVGKTVTWVIDHVPLPPRSVGIFELRAHLVIRPLSATFAHSSTVKDKHNRHAVCHMASYDSFREEYLLPALLNMHSLLRGLDEKMAEDDESDDD
ncbi:hypothetical protein KVH02_36390 [Streptomyces olivaceus]|uniref:Uncharacterized protein n=1 Tax=Streptomyces olivaceus TaxID=47716 RepID=A0ABS7WF01_STROV|nr:hypothetical protein [Streptomyces olivaceus]MBZ6093714.1 hypothetical protein [Streptomyces olivaceus]MBZ6100779.1 hypothetical protein [Streptomyces olivaceus]MBZ6121884.1 hypothetical protein [Streptomyces olivaceus]MBZ6156547.1 hypothetical protein [Streptomyces olivaceus]MBZ6303143.1 hypothetical protein [Streptomyces olivaceus]